MLLLVCTVGCQQYDNSIVVYTSQDQIFAEQIFQDFTRQTGIKVRAVFDNEAVKTVGLANRLLAEKDHPQCDVFWSNEELRTRLLAGQNVFRETNGWAEFGYRTRRIVVSRKHSPGMSGDLSLASLTNKNFEGKIALAYPLFGTTATYFLALRQHWGNEKWEAWCRALAANKPKLVDGNSVVVKFVAQGEASLGLTDSDDIFNGEREGLDVYPLALNPESLLIPNTIAIIRGTKHMESAEKLFQYLQSPAVVRKLVAVGALEGESKTLLSATALIVEDWDKLISEIEPATKTLQDIFVR